MKKFLKFLHLKFNLLNLGIVTKLKSYIYLSSISNIGTYFNSLHNQKDALLTENIANLYYTCIIITVWHPMSALPAWSKQKKDRELMEGKFGVNLFMRACGGL